MKKRRFKFSPIKILIPKEQEILEGINKKSLFDFASKVMDFGFEFIVRKRIDAKTQEEKEKIFNGIIFGLYAKTFRTFRAIIALCRCGLGHEADALLRVMFEACAFATYLLKSTDRIKDAKRLLNVLVFYDKKGLNALLNSRWRHWFTEPKARLALQWNDDNYRELVQEIERYLGRPMNDEERRFPDEKLPDFFLGSSEAINNNEAPGIKDSRPVISFIGSGVVHSRDISHYIDVGVLDRGAYRMRLCCTKEEVEGPATVSILLFFTLISEFESYFNFGYRRRIDSLTEEYKSLIGISEE